MRRSVTLAAACGLALAACRSPTQIELDVHTNVPCTDWQGAAIAVGQLGPDLENALASTTSMTCDGAGHVGTVVVIPAGDDGANVALKVVGAVGDAGAVAVEDCTVDAGYKNCVVARRALRFIPHESLTLDVPLDQSCVNQPCLPDETCVGGVCRSATIPDPTQCETQSCGEGVLPPVDGGAGDATVSDGGGVDAQIAEGGGDATTPGEDAASDAGFVPAVGPCGRSCPLGLGEYFTCVVRDGGVFCWGQDDNGETGNGGFSGSAGPAPVQGVGGTALRGASGIVSGYDTSCAYVPGAAVSCWGGGEPLDSGPQPLAVPEDFLSGSAFAIGSAHVCWSTSTLSCQGPPGEATAYAGDAAAPYDYVWTVPPVAGDPGSYDQLATSPYFTCVIAAGTVYCLGDNGTNESNPGASTPPFTTAFTPVPIPSGEPALEIGLGSLSACARTAKHVYCWGDGLYGENGGAASQTVNEITFADGGSLAHAAALGSGEFHQCALLSSGQVACWGTNFEHELGRGEPLASDGGTSTTAALVLQDGGGALGGVRAFAAGGYHTCAIGADDALWCWGLNLRGELGTGDFVNRAVAVQVTP
jgi:hypothetical protein